MIYLMQKQVLNKERLINIFIDQLTLKYTYAQKEAIKWHVGGQQIIERIVIVYILQVRLLA